jgi:UDP-N-acetylmuramate--alanine ligase
VAALRDEFCQSFHGAGVVIVLPVYAAGEAPIEGATAEALVQGLGERGHRSVLSADSIDTALDLLVDVVRPGDVVITLGAGDVNRLCGGLASRLSGR